MDVGTDVGMDVGSRARIYCVLLTGGIAAGKSAVSNLFAGLGVSVVDTDKIARELVEPGEPALEAIVEAFGTDILDPTGNLDRAKMRAVIFSSDAHKLRLESILHPRILDEARRRIGAAKGPYCLVVVPLFTDRSRWAWIDRVLVVDVDEEVQIERVMARDRIDRRLAESILRSQPSRTQRLALADDVIDNSATLEDLQGRVQDLHESYLDLASTTSQPGRNI